MAISRQTGAMVALCVLTVGCVSNSPLPDETTADGLVRVPSRRIAGVYRLPEVRFTQYQRLILEPPSITFVKGWRDHHPEVSDAEIARIRAEAAEMLRDEFSNELIEDGPYEFADAPAPDVLLVSTAIEDLNIAAPAADVMSGTRTYTPGPVQMKITAELRDAMSGTLVGRVILYEGGQRYGTGSELRLANRVTNAHEERRAFEKWAQVLHEALNVARNEKPR